MPVDQGERLVGLIRAALPADQTIGVALSGGGDSTALLHLCLRAGFRVEAITVDHRLRPESATEAAAVGAACHLLGVRHEVGVWEHGNVPGNLMDAARRARMGLIRAWAVSRGIGVVALGHTRDDVAETVLMGLARSAGVAGLAGLRPDWEDGVRFVRPLLDAGRVELRDWLRGQRIDWVDDPTNDNDRFARVKARKALAALAPLGITVERLAEVAGNLQRVQEALAVQIAAAGQWVDARAGALRFDAGVWAAPGEVQRQVVIAAVRWLSGAAYPPRAAEVERLVAALAGVQDATLGGCRARKGWLMREPRAVGGAMAVGQVWDGRWLVEGPAAEVRALGAEGLRQVPDWRNQGLPREVLLVTPGVWEGERLLAAPLAGLSAEWQVRLQYPFTLRR
ncbi:tRNA lysidine(34) synthetase TilS [Tabrizicola sp.]|uniref:tRNA lysidine(34) synthetase TilS n=1 Tax=Tabrizicola sp. TaxID=2005166 RepID=UPI002732792E|nr:tRNA lysidine(34) synthetase TilS [Tabrizicola sp.]MDP3193713.1 tRNA lysidine(34) synthetase TilS [Tabrizicola sp.]